MIYDSLDRLALYENVLPHAGEVAARVRTRNMDDAPFEIRDKHYDTCPDEKRRFEVHAHTVDLMIGFDGEEIIHVCPQEQLAPAEPLPAGADGMKMDGAPQGHALVLAPGHFIALYPGEAHMVGGQLLPGEAKPVHKWVVKLPLRA